MYAHIISFLCQLLSSSQLLRIKQPDLTFCVLAIYTRVRFCRVHALSLVLKLDGYIPHLEKSLKKKFYQEQYVSRKEADLQPLLFSLKDFTAISNTISNAEKVALRNLSRGCILSTAEITFFFEKPLCRSSYSHKIFAQTLLYNYKNTH